MGGQEEAVRLGVDFRMGGNSGALAVCERSGAYLMTAAGGPRRLTEKEFEALLAQVVAALVARRQMRAPRIDKEFRRAFFMAAGIYCTRTTDRFAAVACPACREETTFESLGIALEVGS